MSGPPLSWQANPLAEVVRSVDSAEAVAALAWAAEQDAEVERVCVRIGQEIREELAQERAAPELADALEAMLDMWQRHCAPRVIEEDSQVRQARAALAKAGREVRS